MRDKLEIVGSKTILTRGNSASELRLQEVLERFGTEIAVALDAGEVVWVTSERKEDWKNERLGG